MPTVPMCQSHGKYPDSQPLAAFEFMYRTKGKLISPKKIFNAELVITEALQQLMIIPRTPSPESEVKHIKKQKACTAIYSSHHGLS
jgi:hypothetical protein